MDIQFKKIISLFFAALSIFICVICTSCSDIVPEMQVIYPRVIYCYSSAEESPDTVLSVYGEVKSEAVRLSSMTVKHNGTGLYWEVTPVTVVKDSKNREYAGCATLRMPEGEEFPEGLYTVIFTDYAGNTCVSNFSLEKSKLRNMPESKTLNKKYIVFDEGYNVIYISADSTNSSDTVERLSDDYPKGKTIREYISDAGKKAIYVLPEVPLRNTDE